MIKIIIFLCIYLNVCDLSAQTENVYVLNKIFSRMVHKMTLSNGRICKNIENNE